MNERILKLENIPATLKERRNFILYRLVQKKAGKKKEETYRVNGTKAFLSNPNHWYTFAEVIAHYKSDPFRFSGIGFVLGGGVSGVKIEACIDTEGQLNDKAVSYIDSLAGYAEIAPSGTGINILLQGKLPDPNVRLRDDFGNVSFYDASSDNFIPLSGEVLQGHSELNEADATEILGHIYRHEQAAFDEEQRRISTEKEEAKKMERKYIKSVEEIDQEIQTKTKLTGLPTIELNNAQLRNTIDEIMTSLVSANKKNDSEPIVYVRDRHLARVLRKADNSSAIEHLSPEALLGIMARTANYISVSRFGVSDISPSIQTAKVICAEGRWPFPRLNGLTALPIIREDGTIYTQTGYDRLSGLYCAPYKKIPVLPEMPTQTDAKKAAGFICEVINDFPFEDNSSRDNTIALFLSPLLRNNVDYIPMGLIDAPTKGTGKTKLAQLVGILASGHEVGVFPEIDDKESESRKMITAALLEGVPVIILDNCEKAISSSHLAGVITTGIWRDRLLGKSEILTLESRALWIATGNNLKTAGDLGRRVIWVRLNTHLPEPWKRDTNEFMHDFPNWMLENKEKFLYALLLMIRAWFAAGKPKWSGRPVGGFEKWSAMVGGILEFAGLTDFLANQAEMENAVDVENSEWDVFFEAVFGIMQEKVFAARDLLEKLESGDRISRENSIALRTALPVSLGNMKEEGFSVRLGKALQRNRDRMFRYGDGYLVLKAAPNDSHNKTARWKLTKAQ